MKTSTATSEEPLDASSRPFAPLESGAEQVSKLSRVPLPREFESALASHDLHPLTPRGIDLLQINVGKMCNQTCRHCHVDAGPHRTEIMTRETMEEILRALDRTDVKTVDLTGGAPEMNPNFRWFVEKIRERDVHVMNRCNLTILTTPLGKGLAEFFAENHLEIVSSLPHYRQFGTDRQRGDGVFDRSIRALHQLNAVGYGKGDPQRRLTLVTNPVGAFLPGNQASLEKEWKRELKRLWDIEFDALFTITNMPISRFLEFLDESNNLEAYLQKIANAYNPAAAENVMCRNLLSVGWDGLLYDCDFNQMLDLPVSTAAHRHIRDFDKESLNRREIVTGRHCFGCTAGSGSSCGGSTS